MTLPYFLRFAFCFFKTNAVRLGRYIRTFPS